MVITLLSALEQKKMTLKNNNVMTISYITTLPYQSLIKNVKRASHLVVI